MVRRTLEGMRDLAALSELGATEVILDLNLSPGAEDAERVLDAFAPSR